MWEQLPAILPFMIPILGISIGIIVMAAIFVVQPVLKSVNRWVEIQEKVATRAPDERIAHLTNRIETLESRVQVLSDVRDFDRELLADHPGQQAPVLGREAEVDPSREKRGGSQFGSATDSARRSGPS